MHALALALSLQLHAAPPIEAPTGVTLRWDAPEGCPTADELRRGVEALLGAALDAPGRAAIEIDGRITRDAERWALTLRIANDSGARLRELPGAGCEELTDVAVVLIAVAIDPESSLPGPEPTPTDPTPPPIDPPTTPARPTATPPTKTPPRNAATSQLGAALGVHAALGFGALPRIAGGLGLEAALLRRRLRVELGGTFWLPRDTTTDEPATGTVRLWHLDARACGVPGWRRVQLPLCGGLQAGAMSGRAQGVLRPRSARLPWFALEAGAGVLVLPTPRVGLRLDVRGAIPLVRPGFAIDGQQVHRARAAGVVATFGVELRLP